jgi:hypothetical protein
MENFLCLVNPAAGAGLTGSKMARRVGGVDEFEFKAIGENHNQGVIFCSFHCLFYGNMSSFHEEYFSICFNVKTIFMFLSVFYGLSLFLVPLFSFLSNITLIKFLDLELQF